MKYSMMIMTIFLILFHLIQDDKDLVHEFVLAEGLTCLIKVGAEADQNYQNYILRGTSAQLCTSKFHFLLLFFLTP